MGAFTKQDQEFIRRLGWDIGSISSCLEELGQRWAKTVGISRPQWRILLVLAEIDQGEGVQVNAVSKKLRVEPSFVTTQSKLLANNGFIERRASSEDGRIVKLSLTRKAWEQLDSLGLQQESLNEFIFAEFASQELEDLTCRIGSLKRRLETACLKVAADG